jgi:hypothetical protein
MMKFAFVFAVLLSLGSFVTPGNGYLVSNANAFDSLLSVDDGNGDNEVSCAGKKTKESCERYASLCTWNATTSQCMEGQY